MKNIKTRKGKQLRALKEYKEFRERESWECEENK